jgi:hypothetical protein
MTFFVRRWLTIILNRHRLTSNENPPSENENEGKNSEQNEKQNTFAEDLIDVLTGENDKSEKVTLENPILSNIDDKFPTIDNFSPLKSPVNRSLAMVIF